MEERGSSRRLLSGDLSTQASNTTVLKGNEDDCSDYSPCYKHEQILSWLTIITAVVGVAGNTVVLWLLGCRMRRNAVSIYILNLAAADAIILCIYITGCLIILICPLYGRKIHVVILIRILMPCSYITGLSMLSAISVERCLSVLWPIWYRCHRPRHTSAVACGLLWALALLFSILNVNQCLLRHDFPDLDSCQSHEFAITAYLIFLFLMLSGSSLVLVFKMFCGSHRIQLSRLYVTVLVTVLVFLFCGLPYGIFRYLIYWTSFYYILSCYAFHLLVFLSCVNSSANPIIYFFVGSFRQQKHQKLKLVLQRALQDTPERDEPGGELQQETLEMSGSRGEQG